MLRYAFSLVSLQTFLVSGRRKLWFVARVVLLLLVTYFLSDVVASTVISEEVAFLVLIYLIASVASDIIRFFVITGYRRRNAKRTGEQDNFIVGVDTVSSLAVILIVAGSIFPVFNIPFTNFLTSLSLFSVAAAWLFKEYIANFFDSFRLMFSTDFLRGDYIKLGESNKGVITDISFRATKLKTDDGDVLFVPNSMLMNTEVVNYSKVKYKRITVPFTIATELVYDFAQFEAYLTSHMLEQFPDLIASHKIFLRIQSINNGKTSCVFEVAIDQFDFPTEDTIHKAVYQRVLQFHAEKTT